MLYACRLDRRLGLVDAGFDLYLALAVLGALKLELKIQHSQ